MVVQVDSRVRDKMEVPADISEDEAVAVRRGVPDPGIPLPAVAWTNVALWAGSLTA